MKIRRHFLPIGDDSIPMLVAEKDGLPQSVVLSYEAYLELAATLFTAIAALKAARVDPDVLDDPRTTVETGRASLLQVS